MTDRYTARTIKPVKECTIGLNTNTGYNVRSGVETRDVHSRLLERRVINSVIGLHTYV